MGTTISVESTPGGGSYVDLSAYIVRKFLTVKVNTLDFTLNNPPAGSTQLTAGVKLTDPAWSGTIASVMTSDRVAWRSGIKLVTVSATNAKALVADTAPFDISDVPTATPPFDYLLEDGSGHYLLEDGTDFAPGAYMLEGALSYDCFNLSVRTSVNATAGGPPQTQGRASLYQPGLRPGNIFNLTSLNQGYSAAPFEVTQVTITWPSPTRPEYSIEFGDTPQTLSAWTLANAAPVVPALTPPILFPAGTSTWGKVSITGTAGLRPMGEGDVVLATSTFTINPDAGHSLTCQVLGAVDALAYSWDNTTAAPRRAVRALLSGGIFTGTWQELPSGWSGGPTTGYRSTFDLSSVSGLALAAGTYTVSIHSIATQYNQLQVFSGWVQVAVTQT